MASHESDLCILCGIDSKDELMGPMMRKCKLVVHRQCLYLTHPLAQNSKGSTGICGFYLKDIREAARKCQKYICFYCEKPKANLACWTRGCTKRFHYSCGLKNHCKARCEGTFAAFCNSHAMWINTKRPGVDDLCSICTDPFTNFNPSDCLIAYCCEAGWFHRRCISKYAYISGLFFECPLCKDRITFPMKMRNNGVYVPNHEGYFDVENDATNEMFRREILCNAAQCLCRQGRAYNRGRFSFIRCADCGSNHCHFACLVNKNEEYKCDVCQQVSNNI